MKKFILTNLATLCAVSMCTALGPELNAALQKSAAAALEAGTARVIQEIGPKPQKVQPGK